MDQWLSEMGAIFNIKKLQKKAKKFYIISMIPITNMKMV
jgi:hypothetical protein